jgi:inorganic triphosphatase YgiF
MEIELKLLADESDLVKLEDLPLVEAVSVGKPSIEHQLNVYFDTPDLQLHRAGMGLRVRHVDNRRVQTLKAANRVTGGLHQREEWETEIDGDRPDLMALRELVGKQSPYAELIAAAQLANRLQPVFTTKSQRTVRQLRLRTGEEVELAIDRGVIEHEQGSEAISEIELELKSGAAAHLYAFALELLEAVPMRIGIQSKAQRGYASLRPEDKRIVKAEKLQLHPSMTVEDAFEAVVANCMQQVQGNTEGVTYGTDPESVHQMRVGLRRLRSALDLFREAIECPSVLQEEWRWLGTQLGAARDWEVLADSTLSHIEDKLPSDVDVAKLKEAALAQAKRNRDTAAQAVNSPRHTRLQLQFAEWMTAKGWRSSLPDASASDVDLPLKKYAKQVLKHGEARLLKRGKRLRDNEPESRHRVRIAGKKARYATEFFGSLYPKGKVKDYVSSLSDLQEELGWLNDAAVAIGLLGQLQAGDPHVASSAAFARGYLYACVYNDHAHLMQLWSRFADVDPPYKH